SLSRRRRGVRGEELARRQVREALRGRSEEGRPAREGQPSPRLRLQALARPRRREEGAQEDRRQRRGRMMKVGVVGLGIMGSAMWASLEKKGFKVYGFDVLPKARAALKRAGGIPAEDVFAEAKIIITSLPSAQALHGVCKAAEGKGAIVIETSTLP